MNKLSLRWRITILMGVLVLLASALLTALSIHNAANNFVLPFVNSSAGISKDAGTDNTQNTDIFAFDHSSSDLPDGTFYMPEIDMDITAAQQSFSMSSVLYLALITAGSMLAAYYLAGRAMRPIFNLSRELKQMDGDTLSKRVSIPQTTDEIANLSLSFNMLLEKLEREFQREKQFSANVAHELKTPLATMMVSAGVLKSNEQTTVEEYRENLDITLQSTRRLSNVVEGLLMLSKTDSKLSFDTVNIPQMFHDIMRELEPSYFEKHITIMYHLDVDTLVANQLLLYRALFNLIENAYKYTEQNGVVTISSFAEEDEVIISISDTGIGIPTDDITHIFEPFYRADKSRSRKIAGAGLGLAITKEILDLHKAQITVQSEKNSGTMIQVHFKCTS